MSDIQYISGILKSAATLTGITGAKSFKGEDSQGHYVYNIKLDKLAGSRVRLIESEQPQYDYTVYATAGIGVRDDWLDDIQTEVFWDQVPVDTKVEVSNDESTWKAMHFAEYDSSSPNDTYYYVWVEGRTSHSAIGRTEVFEVSMLSASSLNSKYFLMYSHTKTYYVWFNVDSSGSDPAGPGGDLAGKGYTEVEVALNSADSADLVATKTKVVINGLTEFIAIISPNDSKVVSVAPSTAGHVYDAKPGNSGLGITIRVQGGDKEGYKYARIA